MKKVKVLLLASMVASMLMASIDVMAQKQNVILVNMPFEITNSQTDVMINILQVEKYEEDDNQNLQKWINEFNKQTFTNITSFINKCTEDIQGANDLKLDIDEMPEFELYLLSNIDGYMNSRRSKIPNSKYVMYSSWECYMNEYIVTMTQDNFMFTGGAHGIRSISVDNYLFSTGEKIDIADYVVDTTYFMEAVVKYFCKDRKIKTTAIKAQTGLFYELSELPMPKLIGLDSKGLRAIYEQYEIAPYAAGVIEVVIPFKELSDILMDDFSKVTVKKGGEKYYFDKLDELKKADKKRRKQ